MSNKRYAMRGPITKIAGGEIGDEDLRQELMSAGIDEDELTNSSLVAWRLFEKAREGDIRAIEKWQTLLEADDSQGLSEVQKMRDFRLPANIIAKSFVDVNRDIDEGGHVEYVFKGGRGSAKSSYISLKIIELLLREPEIHAVAMRAVADTMRDSVFSQLRWAIEALGLEKDFRFTVSPLQITRLSTNQRIYFRGGGDPAKLKSIRTPFGYVGVLWLEELDGFRGEESVRMIEQSVMRGGEKGFIFKSFNPPKTASNWANRYVRDAALSKGSVLLHHSDYRDVPREWLGQVFLDEAEHLRRANPAAYEHEYGGNANGTGGQVFGNLVLREISEDEVRRFDRIYQGLDWGWFPDPLAFIRLNYHEGVITVIDEIYRTKLPNDEVAGILRERKYFDAPIRCDSAEPKSIQALHSHNLPVKRAVKGPGSVEYSMKWLQGRAQIVIDPKRTPNAAREFANYEFMRDKNGEVISGYPDADNHLIDALRYALEPVWMR